MKNFIQKLVNNLPDPGCKVCKDLLDFDFTFAFQPIVDAKKKEIYAYEALVRGLNNEGASEVLAKVNDRNRYRFDQECRIRCIYLAKQLGITSHLSINFLPRAVYQPELCLRSTIAAAEALNFPLDKIIFEMSESEHLLEPQKLINIFHCYKSKGFTTAIDDFGAGFAGLGLLSDLQPNLIKLDIKLVHQINSNPVKQAIVKGIIVIMKALNVTLIAEGVETADEANWFIDNEIYLMQGYFFSRPAFEALPPVENLAML